MLNRKLQKSRKILKTSKVNQKGKRSKICKIFLQQIIYSTKKSSFHLFKYLSKWWWCRRDLRLVRYSIQIFVVTVMMMVRIKMMGKNNFSIIGKVQYTSSKMALPSLPCRFFSIISIITIFNSIIILTTSK